MKIASYSNRRLPRILIINFLLTKILFVAFIIAGINISIDAQVKNSRKRNCIKFTVTSPKNIPVERRVREIFPLRNYVFFDLGSTEIPDRYVLLSQDQVNNFNESQLEVYKPKILSGRSDREMIVYYNVMNILGNRMSKNPASSIKLIGTSESVPDDGILMAESIKKYLVDIFGIDPTRINAQVGIKQRLPSKQIIEELDLKLLREDNRRVSIESDSPDLLMEFQSGSKAPLKPVELVAEQDAPIDSYVNFMVEGAEKLLSSWSMDIIDDQGAFQNFGPFTHQEVYVPGKILLGTRSQGNFKVTLMGKTKKETI